ncbi:MAG: thioesterase family protein [Bacteroidales bacterium]|nr:thioesterase family protein [Bacteroidales bacterium]
MTREDIKAGLTNRAQMTVTEKDTAATYKSGALEVFATPGMIALMECSAFTLLEKYGAASVGTEINVQHLRACLPGTNVWADSTITEVNGNWVKFDVAAYDEKGEIGKGTHTRYIVDAEKFMAKLKK